MNTLSQHAKILLLAAVSLALGVLWTYLFYKQNIGLNFSIFMILVGGGGVLLARVFSLQLGRGVYALIAASLFFSSMVFVRSSELLSVFNVLGSLSLFLLVGSVLGGKQLRSFLPIDYVKVFFLPLRFLAPFWTTFSEIISLNRIAKEGTRAREILRGSLMAAIALAAFGLLFASADTGFANLFSKVFSFSINQDFFNTTLLAAIVTAFFIGTFGFIFNTLHADEGARPEGGKRRLGALETTILLGSINALFLVFILLQISYLFGGVAHLVDQGLTYADYAREGFFQLIAVAILSFLVIAFAEWQIVKTDRGHFRSFKLLSGALVVQVILILVSAFSRLSLYEHAYGFTTIRLYSHAFMIWIGFALFLLSVHIWKNGRQEALAFQVFSAVILFLFAMNALNPDVFIAKRNITRYHETGKVDVGYLSTLSDDALPYTIPLLDDPNEEVRKSFAKALYSRECGAAGCGESHARSWKSARFPHSTAERLIASRRAMLEENKDWSTTTPSSTVPDNR